MTGLQLGREAIADFERLTSAPYGPYQVVREINVPPDAEEAHADLAADPGQNVVLKFADPAGKPLAGVEAYGLRYVRYQSGKGYSARPWWSFVESDSATLYATFPGETRTVWLKHRASGLTKLFRFTPKEGETERTIVLEAPAVITCASSLRRERRSRIGASPARPPTTCRKACGRRPPTPKDVSAARSPPGVTCLSSRAPSNNLRKT